MSHLWIYAAECRRTAYSAAVTAMNISNVVFRNCDARAVESAASHGKIPSQAHDTLKLKRDIESLERTLQEKVKVQAFEEAAVVRDQIQALKDGGADE